MSVYCLPIILQTLGQARGEAQVGNQTKILISKNSLPLERKSTMYNLIYVIGLF